jgi:hypothetical protein
MKEYIFILLFIISKSVFSQSLNWLYKAGGVDADYGAYTDTNDDFIVDAVSFQGECTINNNLKYQSRGNQDILVRNSNKSGILQWIAHIGGNKQDVLYQVKFDDFNNVFLVGYGSDSLYVNNRFVYKFPSSGVTGFILKLQSNGSFGWIKPYESSVSSEARSLGFTHDKNIIVTGHFQGLTNFEISSTTPISLTSNGANDIFIQKISAVNGNNIWLKSIGDIDQEYAYDLVVDTADHIVVVGEFRQSCDFNPGNGTNLLISKGLNDGFVIKLTSTGQYVWSRSLGGPSTDICRSIALDNNENQLIVGGNYSDQATLRNNEKYTSKGSTDIFVTKISESGLSLWVETYGDAQMDAVSILKTNKDGIIFVGGQYRGKVDFDNNPLFVQNLVSNGGQDVFILTLNQDGSYSDLLGFGGQANDQLNGVAIQEGSNIIICGGFGAVVDFDPSSSNLNIISTGNLDGFLLSVYECIAPHIESIESDKTLACFGDRPIIRIKNAYLNGAISWTWSKDSCNALSFAAGTFINPRAEKTSTFYVKGIGGCVQNSICVPFTLDVYTDTLNYQIIELCEGDTLKVGSSFYTSRGVYTDSLVSVFGCDSVIVSEVLMHPTYRFTKSYNICFGDTVTVGNNHYTLAGTYTNLFSTINGCDSIIISKISFLPSVIQNTEATICEGSRIKIGDTFYSAAGTYIQSSTGTNGCEDLLIIKINTINTKFFVDTVLCDGETYMVGSKIYTKSGVYVDTLQRINGCDSIIYSDVKVFSSISRELDITICEGDTVRIGNSIYSETGNFIDRLVRTNGCDSIILSNIRKIKRPKPVSQNISICMGDTLYVGQNAYFTSGTYRDTIPSVEGCDSVITSHVFVVEKFYRSEVTICEGESFIQGQDTLSQSGNYEFPFQNLNGCDSIVSINVKVLPKITSSFFFKICPGDSITAYGYVIKDEIRIVDTLSSVLTGCDSVRTIDVKFDVTRSENQYSICQGDTLTIEGLHYTNAGIYVDTIQNTRGCDSILTINVKVYPSYLYDTVYILCKGESITVGSNTYFNSGKFVEYLNTSLGCDSIVNFEIKINAFIPQIYLEKDTLKTLDLPDASYQWLECINNELIPILGATKAFLKVRKNGNYALAVTYQRCVGVTSCISVNISNSDNIFENPKIFPNPTSDILTIHLSKPTLAKVYDYMGREMIKEFLEPGTQILHLNNLQSGMYLLVLDDKNNTYFTKVIKL